MDLWAARLVEADIDVLVPTNHALASGPSIAASETELAIGRRVSELIGDGATLQLGLGTVPDAVLSCLHDRRDLGIHSGAISDAVAALAESGVITNSRKTIDNGKTIVGVLMGGARLHEYVHQNPQVELRDTAYTHSINTISALDQFIAINSAVEVDLTGQVNAESVAGRYVGAVGGALDFIRGARLARGGLSVIALPARAGSRSRIVTQLSGPVTTPRSDVSLVATEFGIADLRGTSLAQRVQRMLAIAHPDDRAQLEEALARPDAPRRAKCR